MSSLTQQRSEVTEAWRDTERLTSGKTADGAGTRGSALSAGFGARMEGRTDSFDL